MYVPAYFKIDSWPEIKRFIKETPLATLISPGDEYPFATHIPLELETNENGVTVLSGHVSKGNPHSKLFKERPQVLAVFLSPFQHYISSSWYSQPNVPTWNYMSVQAYGKLRIVEGERLKKNLENMTHFHEQISNHPMTKEILQSEIEKQIDGIVGFEIDVEKIEAAYKMSQNRNDEDYRNIIRELERLEDYNAQMVARKMSNIGKAD